MKITTNSQPQRQSPWLQHRNRIEHHCVLDLKFDLILGAPLLADFARSGTHPRPQLTKLKGMDFVLRARSHVCQPRQTWATQRLRTSDLLQSYALAGYGPPGLVINCVGLRMSGTYSQ